MMSTEGGQFVMYDGIDHVDIDMQPKHNFRLVWAIWFIGFMIIGSMFIQNLLVGVVIDNFNKIKDQEEMGNIFVTEDQRLWIEIQRIMLSKKLRQRITIPQGSCRSWFHRLINKVAVRLSSNYNFFLFTSS